MTFFHIAFFWQYVWWYSCCSWWMSLILPVNKENTSFYLLHHQLFMIYQYKRNKWLSKKRMIMKGSTSFYLLLCWQETDWQVKMMFACPNPASWLELYSFWSSCSSLVSWRHCSVSKYGWHPSEPSLFTHRVRPDPVLITPSPRQHQKPEIYYYTYSFFFIKLRYYCDIILNTRILYFVFIFIR